MLVSNASFLSPSCFPLFLFQRSQKFGKLFLEPLILHRNWRGASRGFNIFDLLRWSKTVAKNRSDNSRIRKINVWSLLYIFTFYNLLRGHVRTIQFVAVTYQHLWYSTYSPGIFDTTTIGFEFFLIPCLLDTSKTVYSDNSYLHVQILKQATNDWWDCGFLHRARWFQLFSSQVKASIGHDKSENLLNLVSSVL